MDPLFKLPQKPSILDLFSIPVAQQGNAFSSKLEATDVRHRQENGGFKITASSITLNVREKKV